MMEKKKNRSAKQIRKGGAKTKKLKKGIKF